MTKTVEIWRWRVTDPFTGERVITPYRMSAELALIDDPTAERIEGTGEVRVLGGGDPKASAEAAAAAFLARPWGYFRPGGPMLND